MILPESCRDPGFRRHIDALKRAEAMYGRDSAAWRTLLAAPWVTDHPFRPEHECHCPHGHVDAHEIASVPERHDGREHRRRRCLRCGSTWLEWVP